MNEFTTIFEAERPKLTALCYRMLGECAGAEDAVQDTWLRWENADRSAIKNHSAWPRRTAGRIAIDALRSARSRRETYVGPWLPEPLIEAAGRTVEEDFILAQECSLALLWAMERLNETERLAFILREAFDAGYDEIATTLNKSEAACRQLVSRAHKRLQESGPRFDTPEEDVSQLLARFFAASAAEDFGEALSLLAPDAIALTDGGRKARAARRPLIGPQDILQVWAAIMQKANQETGGSIELGVANGAPALVRRIDGKIDTVITVMPNASGQIAWLYAMRNPDKL